MGKTEKSNPRPGLDNSGTAAGLQGGKNISASVRPYEGNEQVLPRDAAGYVHEMAIELKDIAETARLSFLAYLLDLVIEESSMQKRGRL